MRVGILGGGQLAQMLVIAGVPLGIDFFCFSPESDCPANKVTKVMQGDYIDQQALQRFSDSVDVMTFESENISTELLEGVKGLFFPSCNALKIAQDRLTEKRFFRDLTIPVAEFLPVNNLDDLYLAMDQLGFPLLIKTRRDGYDGKGQILIHGKEEASGAFQALSPYELIAEKWISFETEVSLIAARNASGQIHFYPLTENFHRQGILRLSKAPFLNDDLMTMAQQHMQHIMEALSYVGVLTIEFFVQNQRLIANEMAPRVHNSGHWTIEGAQTSQFENHLRAILNWPLGATEAAGYSAMINFIGQTPSFEGLLEVPSLHIHLYGKSPRKLRKLGHATICNRNKDALEAVLKKVQLMPNLNL